MKKGLHYGILGAAVCCLAVSAFARPVDNRAPDYGSPVLPVDTATMNDRGGRSTGLNNGSARAAAGNEAFKAYADGRSGERIGPAGEQGVLKVKHLPDPGTLSLIISAFSAISGLSLCGWRRPKKDD